MAEKSLQQVLEESGAILKGHFKLTSGRHSHVYFEKFRVLEQPAVLTRLCAEIAAKFQGFEINRVAGPTTGGIIAFDVARYLGCDALYVERENDMRVLRRGAEVPAGAKVLIVDDVLTTGLSVRETIECIQARGGEVIGVGVLIDRSGGKVDFGVPLHSAFTVESESYAPDEVPAWLAEIPITKPGTRAN
jgi:orotate phosphoribosyltransferase